MKLFYFSFLICILFFSKFSVAVDISRDSPQNTEVILESQFSNFDPFIPLMIQVESSGEIYEDFRWSIKVLRVIADGIIVEPKPSAKAFDDVNSRSLIVSGNVFIYKTQFNDLLFGNRNSDGEYSLTEYLVPYDVNSLDVRYQFVYRDGTKSSSIYRLKAYRVD